MFVDKMKTKILLEFCVFLITITFLTQPLHSQWYWQSPVPTGNQFQCVKLVNSQTGYAAGILGTIAKTTDGGLSWVTQKSNTQTLLYSIDFINANTGIAVGDSAIIVRTTNGGTNWTKTKLFSTGFFRGIDLLNDRIGFIAGGRGFSTAPYILKTYDAGLNWTQLNSGVITTLHCVSFLDSLNGVIGGASMIIKTTDGGTSWYRTLFSGGTDFINSVQYIDPVNVVAFQDGDNMYKSTNGGNNWVFYPLFLPSINGGFDLGRYIRFADANTGLAISDFGRIGKTTNGGVNWTLDTTYTKYDTPENIGLFWGLDFIDNDNALIAGSGGKILRTTNGAQSWEIQNGFKKGLNANYFTDANTGYTVGDSGKIFKTTNAGDGWNQQQSGTIQKLNSVYFTSRDTGYVVGDTAVILKTTNAGTNWLAQSSGLSGPYKDIFDIHFLNSNTGILGADSGKIIKTTNAGDNWNIKIVGVNNSISAVWFLNSQVGISSSTGGLYRSTNAGNNWFVQITGINVIGADIFFSDSLNGLSLESINKSYKTTNGGVNWFQIMNNGADAALYSVSSIDNSLSYACGGDGYIVKTTNGGLNWTRLPRITTNYLNSVYFTDPSTGYISGEFGTLLKTTNGGMTFITKENSFIPNEFKLNQNYPNPFNPSTTISYKIQKSGLIQLKLFDIAGKEITSLIDQQQSPGEYKVLFDASAYPSGIYFYSLYSNGILLDSKKCLLIK